MAGMVWVTDREPGVRALFGELLPDAEVLTPDELDARIALGQRPDALVVDGTQLVEQPARRRSAILALPRVLICTGLALSALPAKLVSSPNVAVLAKPFCMEDLEAALDWLRGTPTEMPSDIEHLATVVRRPRARRSDPSLPTA